MNYKNCPNCDELLPETCFHANKRRKSGLRVYCKACEADMHRDWRVKTGKTKDPYTLRDPYLCDK